MIAGLGRSEEMATHSTDREAWWPTVRGVARGGTGLSMCTCPVSSGSVSEAVEQTLALPRPKSCYEALMLGVACRPERPQRPVQPCSGLCMRLNSELLPSKSRAVSLRLSGRIHPGWILPAGAKVPRVVCPASGQPPWVGVCLWTLGRPGARGGPGRMPPPYTRLPFPDPQGPAPLVALSVTGSCTGMVFCAGSRDARRPVPGNCEMKVKCAECIGEPQVSRAA